MKKEMPSSILADLVARHALLRQAILSRLDDFARVKPQDYFYELAYCLLTPQSSARHADAVVDLLRGRGFAETGFDPEPVLRDKTHYIRFHRTKSLHLLKVRSQFPLILQQLSIGSPAREQREWLVKNVRGLGQKEATHFLRNIGRNGELAILDRHILRNLKRYGAIRTLPASLSKKEYLSIERRFQRFAGSTGIPLNELDLLFWSMETGEIRK